MIKPEELEVGRAYHDREGKVRIIMQMDDPPSPRLTWCYFSAKTFLPYFTTHGYAHTSRGAFCEEILSRWVPPPLPHVPTKEEVKHEDDDWGELCFR